MDIDLNRMVFMMEWKHDLFQNETFPSVSILKPKDYGYDDTMDQNKWTMNQEQ